MIILEKAVLKISHICKEFPGVYALNNVSFTVGNVPWKIYRVGSIYFAVFGRPDEPFPKAELANLAAGLNRKPKT